MRYNKRVDANQAEVVEKLRALPGVTVQLLHGVGDGCPDLLVGCEFHGIKTNYLIELKDGEKTPSRRKLTEPEEKWHREWTGQVQTCISFEECFLLITGQTQRLLQLATLSRSSVELDSGSETRGGNSDSGRKGKVRQEAGTTEGGA